MKSCCGDVMAEIQRGVLEGSKMYFYSGTKREMFFYPVSAGHFYCDGSYSVSRQNFNSILLFYAVKGEISFCSNDREYTLNSGQLACINCYCPHSYRALGDLEAYWVHIAGGSLKEMFSEAEPSFPVILNADFEIRQKITNIYENLKNGRAMSEWDFSYCIYSLLNDIHTENNERNGNIGEAVKYISENWSKPLTVSEIANASHLSPSQFSRNFKKQTGASPYDYILEIRLAKAKELLKNSQMSVGEIAYKTGFSCDSNFISLFKKKTGISPLQFRKMRF